MQSITDRYELLEVLGQGAFGTVYRGRFHGDGSFAKDVAIKVLTACVDQQDEIARRLRDEGRLLGLLRHRAIVKVDRLMQSGGRWGIIMEYVEGVDLACLIRRGSVPAGPALEIAAEVASALQAAWSQVGVEGRPLHILHRDIKPSNIQITPEGEVKVLDFGIALAESFARETMTRTGILGTLLYMAPERFDRTGGKEADLYSLGAVLFEMLTGTRLGRTGAAQTQHAATITRAQANLEAAGVHPELVGLVLDAIAWCPEDRPTAAEFERRCLEYRRALLDETLRDWARAVVPLAVEARVAPAAVGAPFTAETIAERALPVGSAPPSALSEAGGSTPLAWPARWLLLGLVCLLSLAVGTVSLLVLRAVADGASVQERSASPKDAPTSEAMAPAPAVEPDQREADGEILPEPHGEAPPLGEVGPDPHVAGAGSNLPKADESAAPPASAPSSSGRKWNPFATKWVAVQLVGDASGVVLTRGRDRLEITQAHGARAVPVGRYEGEVQFAPGPPTVVKGLELYGEQTLVLKCERGTRSCDTTPR